MTSRQLTGKIAVISTTFYPHPVVGAVRMSQWLLHLAKLDWECHAICRNYGFTATREELDQDLGKRVFLHHIGPKGHPASEPSRRQKLARGLRSLIWSASQWGLVPDPSVRSWKRHFGEVATTIESIGPDVIVTSSPHHSVHWAGRELARKLDVAWVADFRDPALIGGHYSPRGMARMLRSSHDRFFESIYREADLIVHAIPLHHRWSTRRFPNAKAKMMLLPNGVSDDLLNRLDKQPEDRRVSPQEVLKIKTAGSLPAEAIELFTDLSQRLSLAGVKLEFHHFGTPPAGHESSSESFRFHGAVPYEQLAPELIDTDVSLAMLSPKRATLLGLSSKCFDAIAIGKPLIVIRPTRSDRIFLTGKKHCHLFEQPDTDKLEQLLLEIHRERPSMSIDWLKGFREQHRRSHQTQMLAARINACLSPQK